MLIECVLKPLDKNDCTICLHNSTWMHPLLVPKSEICNTNAIKAQEFSIEQSDTMPALIDINNNQTDKSNQLQVT